MPLVLSVGNTWEDPYGNEHGYFIAYIKNINIAEDAQIIDVDIQIYTSEAAHNSGKLKVKSLSYSAQGAEYASALIAYKNVIRNQNKELISAMEILILQKPVWGDWEQQV